MIQQSHRPRLCYVILPCGILQRSSHGAELEQQSRGAVESAQRPATIGLGIDMLVANILVTEMCICVYSPDGAGWVAGIRKDISAETDEQTDVVLDDDMVDRELFCLNLCYQLITIY